MNYEKKYKDALERAKEFYILCKKCGAKDTVDFLEDIFPELKESEDERIRKSLIILLQHFCKGYRVPGLDFPVSFKDMLTWLEKQGEPVDINPSEFDLRLNKLLKQFESLPKEELANSLSFYLNVVQNDGTYKPDGGQGEQGSLNTNQECLKGIKRVQEYQDLSEWEKEFDNIASMYAYNKNQEGYDNSRYVKERADEMLYHAKKELKKQGEQKLSDKIEPKFHEGEWITNGNYTWKIVEVKPLDYILQSQEGNIVDDTISHVDEQFHSFTIKDAKDGDVLACPLLKGCESGEQIFIFKGINSRDYVENCIEYYCRVCEGEFYENKTGYMGTTSSPIYPATKEQRDLLFQKIKDAGYKWDEGKKELKKIEKKSQRMISAEAKEALYDKPTDNDMVEALRTEYEKGRADAIAEMQKEWSEEDKNFMYDTLSNLTELKDRYGKDYGNVGKCMDWIKSLKQRIGG